MERPGPKFDVNQPVIAWHPKRQLPLVSVVQNRFWKEAGDVPKGATTGLSFKVRITGWWYNLESSCYHEKCLRPIDDDGFNDNFEYEINLLSDKPIMKLEGSNHGG